MKFTKGNKEYFGMCEILLKQEDNASTCPTGFGDCVRCKHICAVTSDGKNVLNRDEIPSSYLR